MPLYARINVHKSSSRRDLPISPRSSRSSAPLFSLVHAVESAACCMRTASIRTRQAWTALRERGGGGAVFLSDGYVTSCGCMFNLFDGSQQRGEDLAGDPSFPSYSPLIHPLSMALLKPAITHASECKLPEAANHF